MEQSFFYISGHKWLWLHEALCLKPIAPLVASWKSMIRDKLIVACMEMGKENLNKAIKDAKKIGESDVQVNKILD